MDCGGVGHEKILTELRSTTLIDLRFCFGVPQSPKNTLKQALTQWFIVPGMITSGLHSRFLILLAVTMEAQIRRQ